MQGLWRQRCDCDTVGNHCEFPEFSPNEKEKDLLTMAEEHTYKSFYQTISVEYKTGGWGRIMLPSGINCCSD